MIRPPKTKQNKTQYLYHRGFSGSSDGKEFAFNAGELGLIPGSGRSPAEGNGYPLQYSCLRNPMDRGAWQATVHRAAKELYMTERLTLSLFHFHLYHTHLDK